MNGKPIRVLVVAGGTGGHIVPGIALAAEFQHKGHAVHFLTLERNRNFGDFQHVDFPVQFYAAPPLQRSVLSIAAFPYRTVRAILRARKLLRSLRIELMVGMGGYPVLPAILAARMLGVPYYLCEQNAIPGKITRRFGARARRVYINLPLAENQDGKNTQLSIAEDRIVLAGNPLRARILEALQSRTKSNKQPGADGLKRILVLGGSQGATQINSMVMRLIPELRAQNVRWYFQCGERNVDALRADLSEEDAGQVELFGYRSDVNRLFLNSDVLIGRAGAGVISEAACFGLPMILIPYPFAADNHQLANARAFERAGAAVIIDRKDTDVTELRAALQKFVRRPESFREMHKAALSMGHPDAAQIIVRSIVDDFTSL